MFLRITSFSALLALLSGCSLGDFLGDPKQDVDDVVEEVWLDLNQDQKHPAVEYFEKGGKHYNVGIAGEIAGVDRELVLPLVKRLRDELKGEPFALVAEGDDYCWQVVVKLPPGAAARSSMAKAIAETDAKFAGEIGFEWGHKWLALEFHDLGEAGD